MAESPGRAPYPLMDHPLTLSSGTVVRERNFVVFQGQQTSILTITIQTPTPAGDTRLAAEAREIAARNDAYARQRGIDRITIAVCRTQACIELREVAAEMFHFVRASDGTWLDDEPRWPPA